MRPKKSIIALALTLSGCASTELNKNTMDIATNSNSLLTEQTLYNLSNFLDSELALPAQIVVSTGSATTADTASATVSAPLSRAFTATNQLVRTVGAMPSTAGTNIATGVAAGAGLMAEAQDVRTQNYSFQMITDAYQLWRLKALYRIAIDGREADFVRDYPPIYKSVSQQRSVCLHDKAKNNATVYGLGTTADPASGLSNQFQSCVTQYSPGAGVTMGAGTDTSTVLVPDEHFLAGPTCAVCMKRIAGRRIYIANESLKGHWLHWRSLSGAANGRPDTYRPGDIYVGQSGHYELYVDPGQVKKFADFTIFVLAASTQTDSAVTGGSGGGGAGASGAGGGGSKSPVAQPGLLLTLPTGP
jgi:hypothetical protein